MAKTERKKNRFGLVGKNISYSFSQGFFTEKFKKLGLVNTSYQNFDLDDITKFHDLINDNNLKGLNVTIPYKELIIPFLDSLDLNAESIGAVNTIKFTSGTLKGFNTDAYGFEKAIKPHLKTQHKKALLLGTGGASKAIAYVFDALGVDYTYVSRNPTKNQYTYHKLDKTILSEYTIIVNCSPVGTYPNIEEKPNIPYEYITPKHLLFDLIYNPEKTAFLKTGEANGATIQNGLAMLEFQAEKAWEIWNS
ncbi:shikimate dehydrogenase family protein [Croceitalea rosinachiae]|uniref:Shikimate dehydrogenase n=1 Tax=Croceitalea rosinachiae TaxID=3075596 RepID=A0ABU3A9V4_9FLAO|nr:shikimate dehydrogenase [Croceitalea sp. F388]MDT0606972.1 shikimate dehydrogenase [Croceitalea sp. F388]